MSNLSHCFALQFELLQGALKPKISNVEHQTGHFQEVCSSYLKMNAMSIIKGDVMKAQIKYA